MATNGFNTTDTAVTILRGMRENGQFSKMERWALDYAVESIEALSHRWKESQAKRAIRETELALSGEFQVLEEEGDLAPE